MGGGVLAALATPEQMLTLLGIAGVIVLAAGLIELLIILFDRMYP
jgi:hypothetical protein